MYDKNENSSNAEDSVDRGCSGSATTYTPRQWAPEQHCKYCDEQRAKNNTFFPPHHASPRCESGKRNHCTCDTCF